MLLRLFIVIVKVLSSFSIVCLGLLENLRNLIFCFSRLFWKIDHEPFIIHLLQSPLHLLPLA